MMGSRLVHGGNNAASAQMQDGWASNRDEAIKWQPDIEELFFRVDSRLKAVCSMYEAIEIVTDDILMTFTRNVDVYVYICMPVYM